MASGGATTPTASRGRLRRRSWRLAAAALPLVLAPGRASADEPRAFAERSAAVYGLFGMLGSPAGMLGAEASYAPLPWFMLVGGAGLGGHGLQGSAMLRVRPTITPVPVRPGHVPLALSFDLGLGASYGRYAALQFFDPGVNRPVVGVLWTNLEAGSELRGQNGLAGRVSLGASLSTACQGAGCAAALDDGAIKPVSRSGSTPRLLLPYVLIGVGYAF